MQQQVALVTGSAKRLGAAIALRLARAGYFVYVHHLNSQAEAKETLTKIQEQGGKGALIRGDIAKPADCATMAKQLKAKSGRLDVLVNNVGLYRTGPLLNLDEKSLTQLMQTNTLAPVWLLSHCRSLFQSSGGAVVNIGYSGVDAVTGSSHNGAYLASKLALLSLTKSLALELGPRHIRVNMVSPGILANSVELPKNVAAFSALGRLGEPGEVAEAVAWLVSAEAKYVTGTHLEVAGGYMLDLRSLAPQDLKTIKTKSSLGVPGKKVARAKPRPA